MHFLHSPDISVQCRVTFTRQKTSKNNIKTRLNQLAQCQANVFLIFGKIHACYKCHICKVGRHKSLHLIVSWGISTDLVSLQVRKLIFGCCDASMALKPEFCFVGAGISWIYIWIIMDLYVSLSILYKTLYCILLWTDL